MSEQNVGDLVGRYRLESVLGEGGMGRVYRAWDETLHRRVALKVLLRDGAGGAADTDGGARLLREARAAAAFNHPNAITIHDVGVDNGTPYLAMELVTGQSLRERVGDASVSVATRLRWLADVGRALAAAHRVGLMHRDLKPENVMVNEDGVVKVLDFGLARRSDALPPGDVAHALGKLTGEGIVVGTPLYMAPEQLEGRPLDARVDQFAWGVLAYELLTGEVPWTARSSAGLVAEILTQEPAHIDARAPAVPAAVGDVVARAMRKSPDDRFPSTDTLVLALDVATGSLKREAIPSVASATTEVAPAVAMPPPSRWRSWIFVPPVVALLAAGATLAVRRAREGSSTPTAFSSSSMPSSLSSVSPSASSSGAASSQREHDSPLPASTTREVRALYEKGVQELRDGQLTEGHDDLARARKADPSLAAAYVPDVVYFGVDAAAAFRGAFALRASLGEWNRALLAAAEPIYGPRRDFDAARKGLHALEAARPRDCEPLLLEAEVAALEGDLRHGVELAERAASVDPACSGPALNRVANLFLSVGDTKGARDALERCVHAAPQATGCSRPLAEIAAEEGDCRAADEANRHRLELTPESASIAEHMAWAMDGVLAPEADVLAMFHRSASLSADVKGAPAREKLLGAAIALGRGDFVTARARLVEATTLGRDDPSDTFHKSIAAIDAMALDESGDPRAAAHVVLAYLAARSIYDVSQEPAGAASLMTIPFHAGLLTRSAALALPLTRRGTTVAPRTLVLADVVRELALVDTLDAARTAIVDATENGFKARPPDDQQVGDDQSGYQWASVHLLAGDVATATTLLQAHARSCGVAQRVGWTLRSAALLGPLLEKSGDPKGACEAYERVLLRWGHAKPRSVTADAARARAKALGCERR